MSASLTVASVLVAALVVGGGCGAEDGEVSSGATPATPGTGGSQATAAPPSTGPAPSPNTVQIVDFRFSPRDIVIGRGETVTWRNDDPYVHWIVSTDPDVLDSGEMSQAQTYAETFSRPGTYEYYCNIHNYMKAKVTVR